MSTAQGDDNQQGPTTQLSTWVSNLSLKDVPQHIITRAKYTILDGIACALVGAHLPWSEKAANAIFALEPAGNAMVMGWDRLLPPLSAALLNSSFIQGFELDDWHSDAPLHSNSILLPALLAASGHIHEKTKAPISGADFLLANIVGFEVGPRVLYPVVWQVKRRLLYTDTAAAKDLHVGLGLWGAHVLSTGWHSGAVFGPSVSAAAVSKLLGLNADQIEDAFGIACTQACGLMSAQFGSEVKRMQHGFAARNGLLAAFLAQGGYTGIRNVFEQEYGGFLKQFSLGNGKTPQYRPEEISKGLGTVWRTEGVRIKPYAAMAGTHSTIDCIRNLQELYPEQMQGTADIKHIRIKLGEAAFHHGGWKASRPLTSTGAQMSNSYIAATQIVYGQVLAAQFRHDMLDNDEVWRLVESTVCEQESALGTSFSKQTVMVEFANGSNLSHSVEAARGVQPPLTNDEIVEKWRLLTSNIMDRTRVAEIEALVLALDQQDDVSSLQELLRGVTKNPIE
ncbi:hypothetical protein LTR15_012956 [Elasticomyces elasticus]|nr:hypothetical protein LTR15_012956 [Elasticomyces elasticus]